MNQQVSKTVSPIKCQNLSKRFGEVVALDNLSLEIDRGTVFGFLGPNGAGKTTTLRLLAGITKPTSGRIWVDHQEVTTNSIPLRSAIGYLPESPAFYNWMTGREFLRFTADLYGLETRNSLQRTKSLLKDVNLRDVADRKIKTYSRGMQQRLGLAQALINNPKILLLDEPASALDPMGRRDVLKIIQSLKGETTIFISTHILADVERICDRVAIINNGKLVTSGSIEELQLQQNNQQFELVISGDANPIANNLQNMPWIRQCTISKKNDLSVIQIKVTDVETASKQLLKLLVDSEVILRRYEITSPSLEDIFMDLVDQKNRR